MHRVAARLQGGLIVSCQADPGDPFFGPSYMAAFARAAEQGGAVAIRSNGPGDIGAIKQAVSLPVIGIYKRRYADSPIYITPTIAEVADVVAAGADLVAVQLTAGPRPGGGTSEAFIRELRTRFPDLPIMADVSTLAEGVAAEALGVNLVSTTMSGYTPHSRPMDGPDLALVAALAEAVSIPVIAEGRVRTPEECRLALAAGAFAVVVGTAITRPQTVTQWFVAATIAL